MRVATTSPVYPEQPRKYGFRCQQCLAKVVLPKNPQIKKRFFPRPNLDDCGQTIAGMR
jgi:hypothetical protein